MFNLSARPELHVICAICDQPMDEHTPLTCPQAALKAVCESEVWYGCPLCRHKKLTINEDDYYQCYDCNTVFSTGAVDAEDANGVERPRHIVLDYAGDRAIPVVIVDKRLSPRRLASVIKELQTQIEQIKSGKTKDD